MHVHVEGELGVLVAGGDKLVDLTHVGMAAHAGQAGTLVEQGVQLVYAHVGVANQVEDGSRIDIAGAAAHHKTFERGQAHGGVNRLAGNLRGSGSAVADVQDDLLEAFGGLADHLRNDGADILVGGAVGAVTTDVILLGDVLVQRVGAGFGRQLEEEGGIEHEDLRHVRQQLTHDFGALGFRAVVQRGEHGEILDLVDGLVGDERRLREDVTALDHAVADSHNASLGKLRAVLLEEAEHALQALLMIVDGLFELMLLTVVLMLVMAVGRLADLLDEAGSETFAGLEVDQLVLDRAGTRIDDKDGFRHSGHPPLLCTIRAVLHGYHS